MRAWRGVHVRIVCSQTKSSLHIACSLTFCPSHHSPVPCPIPCPILSPFLSPFTRVVHSIRLILKPLYIYIWICTYSTRRLFAGDKNGKNGVSKRGQCASCTQCSCTCPIHTPANRGGFDLRSIAVWLLVFALPGVNCSCDSVL